MRKSKSGSNWERRKREEGWEDEVGAEREGGEGRSERGRGREREKREGEGERELATLGCRDSGASARRL